MGFFNSLWIPAAVSEAKRPLHSPFEIHVVVLRDAVAMLVTLCNVMSGSSVSKGRAISVELEGPLEVLWVVVPVVVETPERAGSFTLRSEC